MSPEIFLVVGDAAGGLAKIVRDKTTQAVLPLQQNIVRDLDSDESRERELEFETVLAALGIASKASQSGVDSLSYDRVIIMAGREPADDDVVEQLLVFLRRNAPFLLSRGLLYFTERPAVLMELSMSEFADLMNPNTRNLKQVCIEV